MKKRKLLVGGLAVTLILMLALTGCSSLIKNITKKAIEDKTGVSVDEEKGSVKVKTKEGEAELSGSQNKIPDGFPDKFPVYEGAKVVSGAKVASQGKSNFYVGWSTDDSASDVASFYKEALPENGYKIKDSYESTQATVFTLDDKSSVSISEQNGKTAITAILLVK